MRKENLMLIKVYCVGCRGEIQMETAEMKRKKSKNGRSYLSGECPVCGKKVSKFVKSE